MGANDLRASLSLDATKWDATLARAEARAEKFAAKVRGDIGKKLGNLFGGVALVSGIQSMVSRVFGRSEEIEKLSREYGRTREEVQLLEVAARNAGLTFQDFMERAKSGAINLRKELEKTRASGSATIISDPALGALNRTRGRLGSAKDAVVNTLANTTGEYLNAAEELFRGEFNRSFHSFRRGLVASAESAGKILGIGARPSAGAQLPPRTLPGSGIPKNLSHIDIDAVLSAGAASRQRAELASNGANELQRIGAATIGSNGSAEQSLMGVLRYSQQMAQSLAKIEADIPKLKPLGEGKLTGGEWK